MDNEDKQAWCSYGEKQEIKFIKERQVSGWDLKLNPEKKSNKYVYDLTATCPVDLKTMKTPFYTSSDYGVPSSRAITINRKDLVRYAKLYPNIIILCDVQYMNRMFIVTIDRAKKLVKAGKAKLHTYENRKDDDKGNARDSYVFDVNDLDEVYG